MLFAVLTAAAFAACFLLATLSITLRMDRAMELKVSAYIAFTVPPVLASLSPWEFNWFLQFLAFLFALTVSYGAGCSYGHYLREEELSENFGRNPV